MTMLKHDRLEGARENNAYLRQLNFYRIVILRGKGLYLGICLSNLKSAALTVLELLTFNAQKFRGHVCNGQVGM